MISGHTGMPGQIGKPGQTGRTRHTAKTTTWSMALTITTIALLLVASRAHAQPAAPQPLLDIGVDERAGTRIPLELRFTNSEGVAVRLGDYFGDDKPVLLTLAYTRCPMLCSLVLDGVAEVVGRLQETPEDAYRLITISIDPTETPHEAARKQEVFLERLGHPGAPERWRFLVGQEKEIRALADSLGFRYAWDARTRQYAHPAVVFVLAPDGMLSRYFNGVRFEATAIEAALQDAAQGRVGASDSAGDGDAGRDDAGNSGGILRCFRFESVLQKYWGNIQTFFRAGALVILAGVVTGVALLFRRERSHEGNQGGRKTS